MFVFLVAIFLTIQTRAFSWDECVLTSYSEVENALSECEEIFIQDMYVPPQTTLDLDLKDWQSVTFLGRVTFAAAEEKFDGPLLRIAGNNIDVLGGSSHYLDGSGSKYWTQPNSTKPLFLKIEVTGSSELSLLHLIECPGKCVSIENSKDLLMEMWTINISEETDIANSTSGISITSSTNVEIIGASVKTQGDCVSVESSSSISLSNFYCKGGNGMVVSAGLGGNGPLDNTVTNVTFSAFTIVDSKNAIHVFTHADGGEGEISNVEFEEIDFSVISDYGIAIQEDYKNGGSSGIPNDNVKITNLSLKQINGTMAGGTGVYILCADGGCSDWHWSDFLLFGEDKNECNYIPEGFDCSSNF